MKKRIIGWAKRIFFLGVCGLFFAFIFGYFLQPFKSIFGFFGNSKELFKSAQLILTFASLCLCNLGYELSLINDNLDKINSKMEKKKKSKEEIL